MCFEITKCLSPSIVFVFLYRTMWGNHTLGLTWRTWHCTACFLCNPPVTNSQCSRFWNVYVFFFPWGRGGTWVNTGNTQTYCALWHGMATVFITHIQETALQFWYSVAFGLLLFFFMKGLATKLHKLWQTISHYMTLRMRNLAKCHLNLIKDFFSQLFFSHNTHCHSLTQTVSDLFKIYEEPTAIKVFACQCAGLLFYII